MERYDAVVVGVGGIGSAALCSLAQRGARVLGVDRFIPPHDRGSTHGQTRVIRQAYFEHPDYVPLLREAYREWHELESRSRRTLFERCGLLEVGPADGVVVPGVLRAADAHGLQVESLNPAEIERRWPALRIDEGSTGVFESNAGYLLVEDCVQSYLEAGAAAGAETRFETEVASWRADGDRIGVRLTSGDDLQTNCLVVTAGPWASHLLRGLNVALEVRRKSLFWFATEKQHQQAAKEMPVYLFEVPNGVFYGFPQLDARGVKVAEHSGGPTITDPLAVERAIDAAERRRLEAFLKRHLPNVSRQVVDHATCLYTMTPDEHFIVDRHPALPQVVFAAGLSGHGYKFAPVLGRALAELALDGGTDLPIGFLSLKRFSDTTSAAPSRGEYPT